MLFEYIRKNSKIMVIIVAVTFAGGGVLVGLSGLFTGSQQQQQPQTGNQIEQQQVLSTVAVVNGEEIDYGQYQQILDSAQQQLAGQIDNLQLLSLKNTVLDQLIEQRLMVQKAREVGIEAQVSETEVESQLELLINSYADSRAEFEQILAQSGTSIDEFKALIRDSIEEEQLIQLLLTQIEDEIEFSEEELVARAERVEAAQILLSTEFKSDEEAREKAEQILEQLNEGLDFAELAREYSAHPSAIEGGELGFVGPGQLRSELDEVLFSLSPTEISEAILTEEGYHILKVSNRQELLSGEESAEERAEIIEELRWEQTERALEEMLADYSAEAEIKVESAELRAYRAANEGDFAQAEADYEQALNQSRSGLENIYLYSNLAQVYTQQEKYEEALEAYNNALEINPRNADLKMALANIYYQMEAEQRAIEELEEVQELALEEQDLVLLYRLQALYSQLGYEEEAAMLMEAITDLQE